MEKSPIVEERIGGRRSRGSGEGTSEGLSGASKGSSRSREERFQIQTIGSGRAHGKGSGIPSDSEVRKKQSREETGLVKSKLMIRSQSLIAGGTWTVDLVPKSSSIQKSGKGERTHESPKVWGHEGSWPMATVRGHIKREA
jgi:hypothetical protein